MPVIRIGRFGPKHLDRVMQIERASFGRMAYSRTLFRELDAAPGSEFLIARSGREIAGYAIGSLEAGQLEVVSIAVDPAYRRAGVGAALLSALLQAGVEGGARRALLMVRPDNEAAIRFYRGFGFRRARVVEAYYEDGGAGWLMRKTL